MAWVEYSEAKQRIVAILADGEWKKSTRDIHEPLKHLVRDGHFGRVRKELDIELRWNGPRGVGSRGRGSYVEWRLPKR